MGLNIPNQAARRIVQPDEGKVVQLPRTSGAEARDDLDIAADGHIGPRAAADRDDVHQREVGTCNAAHRRTVRTHAMSSREHKPVGDQRPRASAQSKDPADRTELARRHRNAVLQEQPRTSHGVWHLSTPRGCLPFVPPVCSWAASGGKGAAPPPARWPAPVTRQDGRGAALASIADRERCCQSGRRRRWRLPLGSAVAGGGHRVLDAPSQCAQKRGDPGLDECDAVCPGLARTGSDAPQARARRFAELTPSGSR